MNKVKSKRNSTLELFRFISAISIVIYHFMNINASGAYFDKLGTRAVEFFFLLSGVFLAKKAMAVNKDVNLGEETFSFTCKRIQSIYFPFICAWIMTFIIKELLELPKFSVKTVVLHGLQSLPELFLLRGAGFEGRFIDGPMWYFSALILIGIIVYPLLVRYKENYLYILSPIFSLCVLGFMNQKYGNFNAPYTFIGFTLKGVLRGFAEINLGVFIYGLYLKAKKFRPTVLGKLFLSIMEGGGYLFYLVYIFLASEGKYDFYMILLVSVSIFISYTFEGTILYAVTDRFADLIAFLGKLSVYLFVSHYTLAKDIFGRIGIGRMHFTKYQILIPYLLASLVMAFLLMKLHEIWKNRKIHFFEVIEKDVL